MQKIENLAIEIKNNLYYRDKLSLIILKILFLEDKELELNYVMEKTKYNGHKVTFKSRLNNMENMCIIKTRNQNKNFKRGSQVIKMYELTDFGREISKNI